MMPQDIDAIVATLGEPVTIHDGQVVRGIFRLNYAGVDQHGIAVQINQPRLTMSQQDAAGLHAGAIVMVRGKRYLIKEVHRDTAGGATVLLSKNEAPLR